jgi:hypothetical protein
MFRKFMRIAFSVEAIKSSSVQRMTVGRLSNMLPSYRNTRNHMVRN